MTELSEREIIIIACIAGVVLLFVLGLALWFFCYKQNEPFWATLNRHEQHKRTEADQKLRDLDLEQKLREQQKQIESTSFRKYKSPTGFGTIGFHSMAMYGRPAPSLRRRLAKQNEVPVEQFERPLIPTAARRRATKKDILSITIEQMKEEAEAAFHPFLSISFVRDWKMTQSANDDTVSKPQSIIHGANANESDLMSHPIVDGKAAVVSPHELNEEKSKLAAFLQETETETDEENEDEYTASSNSTQENISMNMDMYTEYEMFLDSILETAHTANIRKCPASDPSQASNAGSTPQQQQTNTTRSCGSRRASDNLRDRQQDDDDDNDDDEKKWNDSNEAVMVYPYYVCQGCTVRERMIMDQANLIVKSSQTIKVLMDQIKQLTTNTADSSSSQTTTSRVPPPLLATPVIAPSPPRAASVSCAASSTTSPNTSSTSSPKSNFKKKRKKKKNKTNINNAARSYDPPPDFQARGNVKITREVSKNAIPNRIQEQFSNLYGYMNKALAFNEAYTNDGDVKYDDEVRVIDLDFHDKQTTVRLYCVLEPHREREYKWWMLPRLFTAHELQTTYGISSQRLPTISRIAPNLGDKHRESMAVQRICEAIEQTKWSKITVFSPQRGRNKKQRRTFSLIQTEFVGLCVDYLENKRAKNDPDLIPIIMFNTTANQHWIEHVQIIRLDGQVDIGVSFVYDACKSALSVTGVHIDKSALLQQHELLLPGHAGDCHCFDGFVSNIDDLRIGNLDEDLNKIKDLKRMIDAVKHVAMNGADSPSSSSPAPDPVNTSASDSSASQ